MTQPEQQLDLFEAERREALCKAINEAFDRWLRDDDESELDEQMQSTQVQERG